MHKDIHHIIRVILLLSEKAKHRNKNWVERERAVVLDYEHPVQLYCLSVNHMHSGWRGEGTSQFCETDVIVAVAPKPHFWIRFHETNENLQLEEGRTDDLPTV